MDDHRYYVYLVANWNNKVLYTGVTNNLERRAQEHRAGKVPGFTARYRVHKLVYFEQTPDVLSVIAREKEIKGWRREKKNALVNASNPAWRNLSMEWE